MDVDDRDDLFSATEWSTCLKVLEALGRSPGLAPDPARLERAVAKIYKKARRLRRKASAGERQETDRATVAATGRARESAEVADAPPTALRARSRLCYICKGRYREVHAHYHLLCPECAGRNLAERLRRSNLAGRRAVVTGGRIKIGRRVALRLLRDGAEVLVTTRFPDDAAPRYAAEPDFDAWRDRLWIEPLDLRRPNDVLAFPARVASRFPALEILINNAAQSVRRIEDDLADAIASEARPSSPLPSNVGDVVRRAGGLAAILPEPDRRESNSWTARIDEVPPVELLEVLLVNAAAPFWLIAGLRPLMAASPFEDRYVVNVAGLDGRFAGSKSDRHPHINMSKAGLNMITRTSAADLARDGIYLNSVDAGWVTHEGAHSRRARMRARGFVPPLDEVDAAARVLDPIARGLSGERAWGCFFKDYEPTDW
ncbi:SDR family oxidoreductase [Paludisphaera sp.]|uniref:SDR family NAD(P)-dependent oxidoreductase n=1 Tax=Paludisphaera sp. TaxID=2017432 RepID=UPI00301D7853